MTNHSPKGTEMKIEIEKAYRVGEEVFETREEAEEYAVCLAVETWLDSSAVIVADLVAKIQENSEAARAVLLPLMPAKRAPRGPDKAPRKRKAEAATPLVGEA